MARRGRDLELLVETLENALTPVGVKVTSPDFIEGIMSQSMREVDVSLRWGGGRDQRLVIVECRDRKGDQDVNWIEQLSTKSKDVGAAKAVAVSATGFTSGAQNMAACLGIELRTLSQVGLEDFAGWLGVGGMRLRRIHLGFNFMKVIFPGEPSPEEMQRRGVAVQGLRSDSTCLVWSETKVRCSLRDIVTGLEQFDELVAGLEPGGEGRKARFELAPEGLQIDANGELFPIHEILVAIEVFATEEWKPFSARAYCTSDETLREVVSTEFEHNGKRVSLAIHGTSEGAKDVTVRSLPLKRSSARP